MPFTFSIRTALKDSWNLFIKHWFFFGGIAGVLIILNLFSWDHTHSVGLLIVVIVAAIIWSYVSLTASLAAVDGKEDQLKFSALATYMPTFRQFLMFTAIGIVGGVIIAIGFVLLIIPGVYFMTRLSFANYAFVDRQQGLKKSLEYSWHLVKGKIFWTVFLVLLIQIALLVIGPLLFFVGALVAYPVATLLVAHLYRALTKN